MQKYAEAENAIMDNYSKSIDDLILDFDEQAAFAVLLLAKIADKTGRKQSAIEMYSRALKLNPFLWSSFESLCKLGEAPNPNVYFQLQDMENLSQCQGSNQCNIENLVIANNLPNGDSAYITTPQQILNITAGNLNAKVGTPEDSPLANPLCMSGVSLLPPTRKKTLRLRSIETYNSSPSTPSFGCILERSDDHMTPNTPPTNPENNEPKSFLIKSRMQMSQWGNRKESVLLNNKPVFSQTSNVNNTNAVRPSTPAVTTGQNVRRSSRLFSSNNYSVKENNKSPNCTKFVTPKSPSRKTKQRLAKCSLNEFNYMELNTRNLKSLKKDIPETVTSTDTTKSNTSAIITNNNSQLLSLLQLQKQSTEGLMCLLRDLGQACLYLSQYLSKKAIEELNQLPSHQFETSWVYCKLGLAYFELNDYENCVKYFGEVHNREPYRLKYMDIYSTALWHLQKEVTLSALAQDLIQVNKHSPITWIVSGNCFSLHKEHDTAIKFLHRAVQVDASHPYSYTILGHEYIMTEELDKAMNCYRNAIRLDPRHYNAWFGIGTIYSKQERFHSAEINYNRALSINPHSSVILCHIGVVQQALKKTDKALSTLNTAIANDPKNALCKFHRGSIYFNVGRHAEALKELEELKEIVPKESLVYYLIGKVHKKLGNIDLALMHFSWATDLDPKGASSQIKEAFDPSIGRVTEMDQPGTPTIDDQPTDNVAIYQVFDRSLDDSDDSL